MRHSLYYINTQANNITLFFNIFFVVSAILVVFIIFISIIRFVKLKHKKNDNVVYSQYHFFGLKHKFAIFNTLLVIFLLTSIALPLYNSFTNSKIQSSADTFLATADKILKDAYQDSVFALIEQDGNRANSVLRDIAMRNYEFVSIAVLGNAFQETEGFESPFPDVENSKDGTALLNNPSTSEIPDETISMDFVLAQLTQNSTGFDVISHSEAAQRQNMVPQLQDVLTRYNSKMLQEISYYTAKLKIALEYSEAQNPSNYDSNILGIIAQTNMFLQNKANESLFSYPEFDRFHFMAEPTSSYFFYRPLAFVLPDKLSTIVHGTVIVELSIDTVLADIHRQKRLFMTIVIGIILIIIFVSITSSYFLAYTITKPIQGIIQNVLLIMNTKDKTKLPKSLMPIKRFDEIGVLSEKINELAFLLAQSSSEINDLIIGQDVQKMFIPLNLNAQNKKQAISHQVFSDVEFFGYYAGVESVSGDYFDYFKLDENHYIMIKCDVSGKGISAALIMVEIATMFLNYFNNWKVEKDGTNISTVVEKISEFLVDNTIPGRFATFTICLLDTKQNTITVSNAGDNLLHYYCKATGKIETIQLTQTLAAGVLKQNEIPEKMHYASETFYLNQGDILFFYTDGIEDSRTQKSVDSFGTARIAEIAEAALNRQNYTLTIQTKDATQNVDFLFNACDGSIREAILAIVACETYFRLSILSDDEVSSASIDAEIDTMLKKYLAIYETLPITRIHTKSGVVEYTPAQLEPQFDDIAMIMVKLGS
ncbi:MAG: SpoIIE family protein phosphatase [Spirochaetaceae bacterium]|nr:SpoIIE family protein phosphatase [Spirochaetaceae bacterium]